MRKPELRKTEDGSFTLYQPELKETFHSIHGALTESKHIFIGLGLKSVLPDKKKINILELGFGTGLNCALTLMNSAKVEVNYHGIEAFPLEQSSWESLCVGLKAEMLSFMRINQGDWGKWFSLGANFRVFKDKSDIRSFKAHEEKYDLVYFDAFAPDVQPELWTEEVFKRIAAMCNKGAVLVTYSSKGEVKRALKSAGFRTEKHPGPPGKREVMKAILV